MTKVRRLAAIACDKKRVAAEMEMSTDDRDDDHDVSGSSAVPLAAERGKSNKHSRNMTVYNWRFRHWPTARAIISWSMWHY